VLEPPVSHQEFMLIIEDTNRRMLRTLEHHHTSGMTTSRVVYYETSPPPVKKAIPKVMAHSSARAAEAAKQLVPPGVHFTDKPRIPGTMRERYLDHLREACQREYIDVAEMTARMDAMMIANTEDELAFLVHDLPALPEVKETGKEQSSFIGSPREDVTRSTIWATLAAGIAIGVPAGSGIWQLLHLLLTLAALFLCGRAYTKWEASRKNTKKQ